jgi:hypothetical protein
VAIARILRWLDPGGDIDPAALADLLRKPK